MPADRRAVELVQARVRQQREVVERDEQATASVSKRERFSSAALPDQLVFGGRCWSHWSNAAQAAR